MNSINELNYIKNNNNYIEVGATTPLIEFESYIEKYYSDFTKILKRYGSVQIRNVATVAGNIATASPIGDTLPLLLSLDAKVVLRTIKKIRSEEHTSELQSLVNLVCRLLLEKKKNNQ